MCIARVLSRSYGGHQWQQQAQLLINYHEITNQGLSHPTLLPSVIKACSRLGDYNAGAKIHGRIIKHGLETFTSIGNSSLDFYMKFGDHKSGFKVFNSMRMGRDSVSWNVLIHGHLDNVRFREGLWFFTRAKAAVGFEVNVGNLVLVVQACRETGARYGGRGVHGYIVRNGFADVVSVQNSLLSFYVAFGHPSDVELLFDEMPHRDVISWSVGIEGYVQRGDGKGALMLSKEMFMDDSVEVDDRVVTSVIKACTDAMDVVSGQMLHGYVIRDGFDLDMFVCNSLIDMYSKCGYMSSAFGVFNAMEWRNVVSWNTMLSGYVRKGFCVEALSLFQAMVRDEVDGVQANEVTIVALLHACKYLSEPGLCKLIHSRVVRKRFGYDELVMTSLIDAYAKCGLINHALILFETSDSKEGKDVVSWSTMIAAFAHAGMFNKAMSLFCEMSLEEVKFNWVTILNVLQACSVSAELRRTKWAHCLAIRHGFVNKVEVGTALLDTYSKCGAIDASRKVFNLMENKNIVSQSAMISAYGMHGRVRDALALLTEMELNGLKPNTVTMLSVLSACSHGGLVKEGLEYFERMIQHDSSRFKLGSEHYSCLVDMLGRSGDLNTAINMIQKMHRQGLNPGASLWGALLNACKKYWNNELHKEAASEVIELDPLRSTYKFF